MAQEVSVLLPDPNTAGEGSDASAAAGSADAPMANGSNVVSPKAGSAEGKQNPAVRSVLWLAFVGLVVHSLMIIR